MAFAQVLDSELMKDSVETVHKLLLGRVLPPGQVIKLLFQVPLQANFSVSSSESHCLLTI